MLKIASPSPVHRLFAPVLIACAFSCILSASAAPTKPKIDLSGVMDNPVTIDEQAWINLDHDRYKEARDLFLEARSKELPTKFLENHIQYGLAKCERGFGHYSESEKLFKQVIEKIKEDDPKTLTSRYKGGAVTSSYLLAYALNDLGLLYEMEGRFSDAITTLEECLVIGRKKAGPTHPELLLPLNVEAMTYIAWGKYAEAKKILDNANVIGEQPKAAKRPWKKFTLFNWARLADETGHFKDAEVAYRLSLAATEADAGFNSEYCATILEHLGKMYCKQGRYSEAEKAFNRERSIRDSVFGKEHQAYASSLLGLAEVYRDQGRYADASSTADQATKIIADALGADSVELGKCWSMTSSIDRYQGQYSAAEELVKKALETRKRSLVSDHPDIIKDEQLLGDILTDQNRYAEAEAQLSEALAMSEKKFSSNHPLVASVNDSLARLYTAQAQFDKSEACSRRSVDINLKVFGKDSAKYSLSLRQLAAVLFAQKKFSQSVDQLRLALSTDETVFGASSVQVASDLDLLATALSSAGQSAESKALADRASSIKAKLPGNLEQKAAALALDHSKDFPVSDKWAIVIGISNFSDKSINLKYAAKDATDFAGFLVAQENFKKDHVRLLTDDKATKSQIISQLGDGWLGKKAQPNDLVVIYVSSHGSSSDQDVGVNFLVAYDTDKNKLVSTGIPMQWLTTIIKEQVHSKRVVVLLDVCHSGSAAYSGKSVEGAGSSSGSVAGGAGGVAGSSPGADSAAATDAGSKNLFRAVTIDNSKLKLGSGQLIVSSSTADQISWESKSYQNGVFTEQLINALKCNGANTSLDQAFETLKKSVEAEVLRDRGVIQTPSMFSALWQGGDPVLGVAPHN